MKIKINQIEKKYFGFKKENLVLKNITLDINDKEFFVLLGPSGCGKSTLLNIIAGLENPTKGELYFDDTLIASAEKKFFLSPKERNVAMVFQNYALYPHLTVYENIAFPLRISKVKESEIDRKVREAADMLLISKHINSKPSELSGGERQRVAIARAIVREPSVLLLDEPLSNLDAELRTKMRVELKKLQRNLGITTVYVTHDQIEAMTLGDRVAVLKDGYLQQVDTAINLYEKPANKFVAQFIGFPPMNMFEAEVINENSKLKIKFENQELEINRNNKESGKYWVGIRPSDIEIISDGGVKGEIDGFELLGRDVLLYVSVGELEFQILTEKRDIKTGDKINFIFKPSKIHFFKKD